MGIKVGVFQGDTDPQHEAKPVSRDVTGVYYEVEVYREANQVRDIVRGAREVELVKPGGTLVNVGHGPSLPLNPYEGQVWILT